MMFAAYVPGPIRYVDAFLRLSIEACRPKSGHIADPGLSLIAPAFKNGVNGSPRFDWYARRRRTAQPSSYGIVSVRLSAHVSYCQSKFELGSCMYSNLACNLAYDSSYRRTRTCQGSRGRLSLGGIADALSRRNSVSQIFDNYFLIQSRSRGSKGPCQTNCLHFED